MRVPHSMSIYPGLLLASFNKNLAPNYAQGRVVSSPALKRYSVNGELLGLYQFNKFPTVNFSMPAGPHAIATKMCVLLWGSLNSHL